MIFFKRISACTRTSVFAWAISFSSGYCQTNELPEVFVTANRMGQPIDAVLSDVDVLKKPDLETMGTANLSQALGKLAGFQTNSYGTNTVFLRGTESRMTSVYIEGIRIETHDGLRLGGGAPWEMVPLDMVDRLEVVKGPASAMYGSDAMGGVVQLFGKKPGVGDRPQLTQALGSQGLMQTTGQVSGKTQSFEYAVFLSTNRSDGYDTRPDLKHTPNREANARQVGMIKMGYELDSANKLEWVSLTSTQSFKTAPTNYSGGELDISNNNHVRANGAQWAHAWNDHQSTRVRFNVSEVAADSDAPNSDPANWLYDLPWNYKTTATTTSIDHEYFTSFGSVTALLEKKHDKFKSEANADNFAIEGSRSQNAVGIGYGLHSGLHHANMSLRSDAYSSFAAHTSYSLGYGFELSPNWLFSASQASGFKAPTLEQMYGQYGNVTLLAETNVSNELAIQYKDRHSKFRISSYENKIGNLISSRSAADPDCPFCYYNVGRVSVNGVSISGQIKKDDVNLQASADFMNPIDEIKGKELSLRSKQNFRLAVDRLIDDTRLGFEFQRVGRRFDDSANTVVFPAYDLIHVWTKTMLTNEWNWLNRIDNVLNKKYQQYGCTNAGVNSCQYAMPGVTFFSALQWQPK